MIKVLIVDDSMVSRQLLSSILSSADGIEIAGQASDGAQAIEMSSELQPDLITMDVQMPGMDGLQATREIMSSDPRPIIVISAQDPGQVRTSMGAMAAGALAVLGKPTGPADPDFAQRSKEIINTVKAMSQVKVVKRRAAKTSPAPAQSASLPSESEKALSSDLELIAIGSSTGGPDALAELLSQIKHSFKQPVLITQHIASGFHQGLVDWLGTKTDLEVKLAEDGEVVKPGVVYAAPGEGHLVIRPGGKLRIDPSDPVGSHRPAANVMFESVAKVYGNKAAGVILTGMGEDGLEGLKKLSDTGACILAQSEESCVVFGMPAVVIRAGLADRILSPQAIGQALGAL